MKSRGKVQTPWQLSRAVGEAVKLLFMSALLIALNWFRAIVYIALEHVAIDHSRTPVLGGPMGRRVKKYCKSLQSRKSTCPEVGLQWRAPQRNSLFNDFKVMDAVADQRSVYVFKSTSIGNKAEKNAAMASEARLLHKTPAYKGSESSTEKAYEACRSRWARHRTFSRKAGSGNKKSSFSDSQCAQGPTTSAEGPDQTFTYRA